MLQKTIFTPITPNQKIDAVIFQLLLKFINKTIEKLPFFRPKLFSTIVKILTFFYIRASLKTPTLINNL